MCTCNEKQHGHNNVNGRAQEVDSHCLPLMISNMHNVGGWGSIQRLQVYPENQKHTTRTKTKKQLPVMFTALINKCRDTVLMTDLLFPRS